MIENVDKKMNSTFAEFIESWKNKYAKKFDFSKIEEQALFYEGMLEFARFVAKTHEQASVQTLDCPSGLTELKISLNPFASSSKPFAS